MPIKLDPSGKRWVEMEFLTPGTPGQVWQAMATGPGNTAWFTPTTIDERVGGSIRFDFSPDGSSAGEVTVWEPPSQFGYVERDWMPGAPPVATEITITGRPGGRCLVRMIHSVDTPSAEWDEQLEGFEAGWPGFFEVLRQYLAHFAGKPAAAFRVSGKCPGGDREAWSQLTKALDFAGADVGDRRESPPGVPRLVGVVERVHQDRKSRYLIVRLDAPADGIAFLGVYLAGPDTRGSVCIYTYGAEATQAADTVRNEWAAWLRNLFESKPRPA